jgi:xanthine dehydrogenase accessory factor
MNDVWKFLLERLAAGRAAALLQVVDHDGSSPGKTGFRMAVAENSRAGTIGGGQVENELVGRAWQRLKESGRVVERMVRHHNETAESDRSGMVCSGSQTVVLLTLGPADIPALTRAHAAVDGNGRARLRIHPGGLEVEPGEGVWEPRYSGSEAGWDYQETLGPVDTLYIFGGGHVGLALSRVMAPFGFHLVVFDDRLDLDTLAANSWAHEKRVLPFEAAADAVVGGEHEWAVIMTFGHQADERVLRRLVNKPLRYLGLLGSPAKVAQLFTHLRDEGIDAEALARVHAPIGLSIGSRTPDEIAISIVAEIIRVRNRL